MRIVFVDTSAWFALLRKKDADHLRAAKFWREVIKSDSLVLTSEFVLAETYTLMVRRRMAAGHVKDFSSLLDDCSREGILRIERASESAFRKARAVFMKYYELQLSYVDCVSYLIAKEKAADCI